MNAIRRAVDRIDSTVVIMGDGRSLGAHLPINKQATPTLVDSLPRLLFFGNELYDGLHGNSLADTVGGFLSAANGYVENIKFGIVGGIRHPQVNDSLVSYADNQWHAPQPTQFIGYAARSDGYSLSDRLRKALPGLTTERMIALDKLAQTAIFTSQGIPFLSNGEELLRTKKGLDYTSHSSDLVNAVEWSYKELYYDVFSYCRSLIQLRHRHPAFRMGNAESICRHLEFLPVEQSNVVAYRLKDHAGGDEWEEIIVILNASPYPVHTQIPADRYRVIAGEGRIDELSTETVDGPDIYVHPESAMILAR
jgi:pullulanase